MNLGIISICFLILIYIIYHLCSYKKENFTDPVFADETCIYEPKRLYEKAETNLSACADDEYKENAITDMTEVCGPTVSSETQNPIIDYIKSGIETNEYGDEPIKNVIQNNLGSAGVGTTYEVMGEYTKEDDENQKFENLPQYYNYQTCRKKDIKNEDKFELPNKNNQSRIREGTTIDTLTKPYDSLIVNNTDSDEVKLEKKKKYHDLFGKIDNEFQGLGKSFVSSRNSSFNKRRPFVCKKCPLPIIQTYDFSPKYIPALARLPKAEQIRRTGKYFFEKGGTIKIPGSNKCKLCDYQKGCYLPKDGKFRFQTQSCAEGKNRICTECTKCILGKDYLIKFCGEGGGSSDTVCNTCTTCGEDEYKIGGCNEGDSIYDTVCMPKSDCLGYPDPADPDSHIDPGSGKRTYMTHNGYSGTFENKNETAKYYQNGEEKTATLNLKAPFYGKDRMCKICDDCPPNYEPIDGGCVGKNSTKNTICQRKINLDRVLARNIKCPQGQFYDRNKVKELVEAKNKEMMEEDKPIRESLPPEKVNDAKYYPPVKKISDQELAMEGCQTCSVCGPATYIDSNNPGCRDTSDTVCIPHTKCKDDGTETIKIPGTPVSNVVCGPCKCPEGQLGNNPVCDGTENVKNCVDNVSCSEVEKMDFSKVGGPGPSTTNIIGYQNEEDPSLYTYDNPGKYGDSTRPNRCKVCQKKCAPGTFQVGGCDPDYSTDIVCKDHTKCDADTQIVVEPGTSTSDTVCKCIDGYEWQKDAFGQPQKNKKCIQIKGTCWQEPCHPNATCYDNFDEEGKFTDTVCQCNQNDNWIETEDQGFGEKGCVKISDKHSHDVKDFDITTLAPAQIDDYATMLHYKPNAINVLSHTLGIEGEGNPKGTFHTNLLGNHIHK